VFIVVWPRFVIQVIFLSWVGKTLSGTKPVFWLGCRNDQDDKELGDWIAIVGSRVEKFVRKMLSCLAYFD